MLILGFQVSDSVSIVLGVPVSRLQVRRRSEELE
jgi:hypothetical protein